MPTYIYARARTHTHTHTHIHHLILTCDAREGIHKIDWLGEKRKYIYYLGKCHRLVNLYGKANNFRYLFPVAIL